MSPAASYFDNFLKYNYSTEQVARLVNEAHPYMDAIKKSTGTGYQYVDVLIDKNATGVGSTLANAQAISVTGANGNVGGAQWVVPWGEYNGSVVILDKTMAQSASDLGAFFEAKKEEIDSLYREFGDALEQYLVRDSGRSLGSGTISTGVITLTNPSDAVNFSRGMQIQASANDGTGTGHSLLGSGSIGYVFKVNANAGTVTVATSDANATAGTAGDPGSWTSTMYFFRYGDFGGTSTPNTIVTGFGSFVPAADPTGTLLGVNQAVDPVARGGVRLNTTTDVAGANTEQRIKKLLARMSSTKQCIEVPKIVMMHPVVWQNLAEILEARGNRPIDGKVGVANFSKLKIATVAGEVECVANKFMPIDAAYAINPKYIVLKHLDGLPKVVNGDGLQMLRSATANSYEHRITSYLAHLVRAPGCQGRTPVSATF